MAVNIADNLAVVRERMAGAARRAGRDPSDVALVAVSKVHPVSAIREAHAAGQRVFGENYVQELSSKADALADLGDVSFHFIGHLQRNKAKDVVRVGAVVETVDSHRLARAIAQRAEGKAQTMRVMVQVNVGGEAQKSGCAPAETAALIEAVHAEESLQLTGLMTIPPPSDDPEGARAHFAALRALRDAHAPGLGLSMGMSHDLEVAIEEGATFVRVGTAIFGPRPPRT